jgi:hypothetical protein
MPGKDCRMKCVHPTLNLQTDATTLIRKSAVASDFKILFLALQKMLGVTRFSALGAHNGLW